MSWIRVEHADDPCYVNSDLITEIETVDFGDEAVVKVHLADGRVRTMKKFESVRGGYAAPVLAEIYVNRLRGLP